MHKLLKIRHKKTCLKLIKIEFSNYDINYVERTLLYDINYGETCYNLYWAATLLAGFISDHDMEI